MMDVNTTNPRTTGIVIICCSSPAPQCGVMLCCRGALQQLLYDTCFMHGSEANCEGQLTVKHDMGSQCFVSRDVMNAGMRVQEEGMRPLSKVVGAVDDDAACVAST